MITQDQHEETQNFLKWLKDQFGHDLSKEYSFYVNESGPITRTTPDLFVNEVLKGLNISAEEVRGPCRDRPLVDARRIIAYHLKPVLSQTSIGALIGGRDHSTVFNLQNSYTRLFCVDKPFKEKASKFESFIITN